MHERCDDGHTRPRIGAAVRRPPPSPYGGRVPSARWPWSSPSTPGPPGCAASPSRRTARPPATPTASSPSTSPPPGWVEHDPDEIWAATAADARPSWWTGSTARRWPPSASPTSARPPWCGTADRDARCTGRSCGRTGAPPRRCDALPRPATSTSCGARPGLVLDPYFSATKLEWLLAEGGVDAGPRPRLRHGRLLAAVEPHRRARRRRARHRAAPTPAAPCCSTSASWPGRRELTDLFGVPACVPARGAPVGRTVRRHRRRAPRCRRRPGRRASSATSRPPCSARPAFARA